MGAGGPWPPNPKIFPQFFFLKNKFYWKFYQYIYIYIIFLVLPSQFYFYFFQFDSIFTKLGPPLITLGSPLTGFVVLVS
jgi:hypothetical protein